MKVSWQTKKLGEIFQIERGGSPRPIEAFLTTEDDGINWIKIGDTKGVTKYIYETEQKIKPTGLKKTRLVHDGDFILSNSMSFGRPYIMRTTGAIHDGWLVMKEKLPGIDRDFFYYLLSSPIVFNQFDNLAAGSTVRNLNTKLVSSVEVPFPPLDEQKRIVKILDDTFDKVSKAKVNAEKNLQNSKDLFESYLHSVFANQGKDWEEKKLGDISDFQNGFAFKSKLFKPNGSPILRISNIQNGGISYKRLVFFDEKTYKENLGKYRIQKGDLIIAMSGATTGKLAICDADEIFYLNQRVGKFSPGDSLTKEYLYYFLSTKIEENLAISAGAAQPNLSTEQIKDMQIPLPKIQEQKEIVKKFNALSLETKKLEKIYEQKIADLEELKKSLLTKAFAGEL